VFRVPTEQPEADGTLRWDATTVIVVEVEAGGLQGTGWTYGSAGSVEVIRRDLSPAVEGADALEVTRIHEALVRAARNAGRPGVVASAISAVDIALWDLKSKALDCSLASLFGPVVDRVEVYGSGGFTTYDDATATAQLERWLDKGITRVKIKIGESWGTDVDRDLRRTAHARHVVGERVELYVDANGGYRRKQAVRVGRELDDLAVRSFEEPVSSDDLAGLREVRDSVASDVAAGEYGYDESYFARMVAAAAVDCLQIDVTRCGGYTSWLRVAAIAGAHNLDVSAHCAPSLHLPVAAAVPNLRHIEYFADHERVDKMLFDGVPAVVGGALLVDRAMPGHGMTLKRADAAPFAL
jgi:L-alanine-DL-glutamate epimerase-like enolase superfamily enzyme